MRIFKTQHFIHTHILHLGDICYDFWPPRIWVLFCNLGNFPLMGLDKARSPPPILEPGPGHVTQALCQLDLPARSLNQSQCHRKGGAWEMIQSTSGGGDGGSTGGIVWGPVLAGLAAQATVPMVTCTWFWGYLRTPWWLHSLEPGFPILWSFWTWPNILLIKSFTV